VPSLRLRTYGAALLTALIATCALAAPAGAATKPFSVVISPNPVPVGKTVPLQATFTNRATTQTLGSADLTPPPRSGFTVGDPVSVGAGDASVSGNVVHLRNLALAPGRSVTARFMVTVPSSSPCAAAKFTWQVLAKQSNDFNGLPGNDFTLQSATSSLTTSTTCDATGTECTLASCSGSATQPGLATLSVSSPGSTGLLTINIGNGLDCAGYDEILAKDFIVDFLPDPGTVGREKRVTIDITKAAMQASTNNGLSQVNICFGAPFVFDVKPGTPALQPFEGLNIGLLPDCGTPIPNTSPPRVAGPPCVDDRQSVGGGATIVVRAPGGDQDPRFGP
jgi:hypothetical protein